jgi:hypothetical protein
VRNLRGGDGQEALTVGFLVTTSIFTEPAIASRRFGIRLIDGNGLKRLSDKTCVVTEGKPVIDPTPILLN